MLEYYCPICSRYFVRRKNFLNHLKQNRTTHESLIEILLQVGLSLSEREYLKEVKEDAVENMARK